LISFKVITDYLVIIFAETIKVYDGYPSLRKRLCRIVSVKKDCCLDELLHAAMGAFALSQDPSKFYLTDAYSANYGGGADSGGGGREEELRDPLPLRSLRRKEGKRPAILIGLRDEEDEINGGGLIRVYQRRIPAKSTSAVLPVSSADTVTNVIEDSLTALGIVSRGNPGSVRSVNPEDDPSDPDHYQLVKVTLEAGRGECKQKKIVKKYSFIPVNFTSLFTMLDRKFRSKFATPFENVYCASAYPPFCPLKAYAKVILPAVSSSSTYIFRLLHFDAIHFLYLLSFSRQ